FSYTNLSLNDVYAMGYRHALASIAHQGGDTTENVIRLPKTPVATVAFEENFAGHFPVGLKPLEGVFSDRYVFEVDGIGFVIRGHAVKKSADAQDHVLRAGLYIDGKEVEQANFPTDPK